MKVFDSKLLNVMYLGYRMIHPIIDPVKALKGLYGYAWYIRDMLIFKSKDNKARIGGLNLFPILDEKTSYTPFDSHYFFQEIWAYKHILRAKPKHHVDIASKYQFSGFVSLITKSEFVDIRPIQTNLKNLTITDADVLHLPYEDGSLVSLSSLHVLEHIGLGRYGDAIDPRGTYKSCRELIRVLKKGGYLYLSMPIGQYRICFNAHRVHMPQMIVNYCKGLKLVEFSVVDDEGKFYENVDYRNYSHLHYGCGMFKFKKL